MTKEATAKSYTAENEKTLKTDYDPKASQETRDTQVENLADKLGKTVPMIRMKLVNMGIYIKKPSNVSAKTGKVAIRKPELIAKIAENTGKDVHFYRSLENATKDVLEFFVDSTKPVPPELQALIDETIADYLSEQKAEEAESVKEQKAEELETAIEES